VRVNPQKTGARLQFSSAKGKLRTKKIVRVSPQKTGARLQFSSAKVRKKTIIEKLKLIFPSIR
jgi:hypothetical protein